MIKEELRRLYCDQYTLYSVKSLAVLCELQAHVSGILSVVAQMIDGLTDKVQYHYLSVQDCTLYKVQCHYLPVQDTELHSVQDIVPLPACTRHRAALCSVQGTVPLPACTRHRTALCTRYSTITCLYKTQDCTLYKVQYHYLPVQDTGLHSVQGTVPLPACTRHRTALCTRYSTITCLYRHRTAISKRYSTITCLNKTQDCTLYKVQCHYLPVQDTELHSVQGTVPLPACTKYRLHLVQGSVPLPACTRYRTALCTRYSTITCLYKIQDCTLYKVQYHCLPVQDTGLHSVQGTVP
jgi:hypothetical protein